MSKTVFASERPRWVRVLGSVFACALALVVAAPVSAQDSAYQFSITSATGEVSDTRDLNVRLTNVGDPLRGYSFGICNDSLISISDGDVVNGGTVNAADYLFHSVEYESGGWSVGALLDSQDDAVIDPGSNLDMYNATYLLLSEGTSTVEFCGTLGFPLVSVSVIVGDPPEDILPVTSSGTIDVIGDAAFKFSASNETGLYDPTDGISTLTATVTLLEDSDNVGFPNDTQGFKFGLAHDGAHLTPTDARVVGDVAALDGGSGPVFFGPNLDPTFGDGVTIGVVYYFDTPEFIQFDIEKPVIEIDYDSVPAALIDNTGGLETFLTFDAGLASPPVINAVVVDDDEVTDVALFRGIVTFVNGTGNRFRRGDVDGDGTAAPLLDSVALLLWTFSTGATPVCLDAADVDNDGAISAVVDATYLLNWAFGDGPPPPSPGGFSCGFDTDDDAVTCDAATDGC